LWSGVPLEANRVERPAHGVLMDGLLAFNAEVDTPTADQIFRRVKDKVVLLTLWYAFEQSGWKDWLNLTTDPLHRTINLDLAFVTRLLILTLLQP